jgi:uncharacterized membrane protein
VGTKINQMPVIVGIILCELAAFTLALSMNVQRFALSVDSEWFENRKNVTRDRLWGFGLLLYGLANAFYFCALSFAPLSLMSALFSTMLIFNALLAHYLLKERLSRSELFGLLVILCGVGLLGYSGPTESVEYSASDIAELISTPSGYGYIFSVLCMLALMRVAILRFEKRYPGFGGHDRQEGEADTEDDGEGEMRTEGQEGEAGSSTEETVPKWLLLAMMVIYPSMLGLSETLVQICLKAISCMLLVSAGGDSQLSKPLFWGAVGCLVVSTIMVILWLRKVYARFETTHGLPIEYGVVTTFSVLAGLIQFQEVQYTDRTSEVVIAVAMVLILIGISITVFCKAPDCKRAMQKIHPSKHRSGTPPPHNTHSHTPPHPTLPFTSTICTSLSASCTHTYLVPFTKMLLCAFLSNILPLQHTSSPKMCAAHTRTRSTNCPGNRRQSTSAATVDDVRPRRLGSVSSAHSHGCERSRQLGCEQSHSGVTRRSRLPPHLWPCLR